MSMAPTPHAYHQADAQLLAQPGPGKRPHPQYSWDKRCPRHPRDWRGYNVAYAWREATPIPSHGLGEDRYGRLHRESGMLLVAAYGFLKTAVPLHDQSREYRQAIIDHLEDTDP